MRVSTLILFTLLALTSGVQFIGRHSPVEQIQKVYENVDFHKVLEEYEELHKEPPEIILKFDEHQIGDPYESAMDFVQPEFKENISKAGSFARDREGGNPELNAGDGPQRLTNKEAIAKMVNQANSLKKAFDAKQKANTAKRVAKLEAKKSTATKSAATKSTATKSTATKSTAAKSTTTTTTDKTPTTKSNSNDADTSKTLTKKELVDKYVAKAKGDAKAAAIQTTDTEKVTFECSHGECCDVKTGRFKTAGITCYRSPCSGPSQCLGVSAECPPATSFLPDGTTCPEGSCSSGVCVKGPKTINYEELPFVKKNTFDLSLDDSVRGKWVVVDHKIKCSQGGCCNLETGFVKVLGSTCTPSKHECYESESTCNGYESKCPRKAVPDGTPCTNGSCQNGVCISSTPAPANPAPGKLTEMNQKTYDDMDVAIAELDAKISKAKRRQVAIEKAMKRHKIESDRRFLRSALDLTSKKIKSEYELARRAVYPYKTTTTTEEYLDTGAHDYNIHNYIQQLAKEKQNYNTKLYSNATALLQSTSYLKGDGFSFTIVGGFAIFVVALVLIVFIVKLASGGKKRKENHDEDYDNF